jgi:hypothetical protein
MPKRATAEDAKIIMRLYDLRREPEMRKARAGLPVSSHVAPMM